MTAQPIPPQPRRAYPHPHVRRAIPLTITHATIPITLTVMQAHDGIQHLGSCGVQS